MRPAELVRLSVELEYRVGADRALRRRDPTDPEPAPRLSVFQHDDGYAVYFGPGVPEAARAALERLPLVALFQEPASVQRILGREEAGAPPARGVEYLFRRAPQTWEYPEAVRQSHFHIVLHEGRAVAWAWSRRGSRWAEEGTVETVVDQRRRGFGRQALAAWVHDILDSGKLAMFQHREGEVAPERLALSLGGVLFSRFVQYA